MAKGEGGLSFLRRLLSRTSDKARAEMLASFIEILERPDNPNLADDEEERIFKDPTTGRLYTKVVKIDRKKMVPARSAPPYPDPVEIAFTEADRISVEHGGQSYELSVHFRPASEDGDDILQSSSAEGSHLVHPEAIWEQVVSRQGVFLSDVASAKLDQLKKQPCLRVKFMDDSRNYHDVSIGELRISVFGKYQGVNFYLLTHDDDLLVATEQMYDANADEVPVFLTTLQKEFISRTSAVFDQYDEMWYYRSP